MTNVSKRKLNKTQYRKLKKQLTDLFAQSDRKNAELIFSDLFTEVEQIMYIKRLAAIVMLDGGYSRYRISKTLLLSQSTVQGMWEKFEAGAYTHLTKRTRSKSFDTEAFWQTVEVLLRGGLPPIGKGRWDHI